MKLLDPFAGLRLAAGHPFVHAALFGCSWFVTVIGDNDFTSTEEIVQAFFVLRWGHFILLVFSMMQAAINQPSTIPEQKEEENEELTEEEKQIAKTKIIHRDGAWKLLSRLMDTLAVIIYHGAVFEA